MSDRQKILDRIRKKEQEIQVFEEKIKAGRIYIQALQDVIKIFDAATLPPDASLKPGSTVAQARDLILRNRVPMHLNELLNAMGKEATREAKASLTSSLAAYVRRAEIFTRTAPSTFGLVELGHEALGEDSPEPPPAFGAIAASHEASPLDPEDVQF